MIVKFGIALKNRRQSLNLSLRDVEKISNVSAALITKLENGKMANFPKALTIKQLSNALKFNKELFVLADIFSDQHIQKSPKRHLNRNLGNFWRQKPLLMLKTLNKLSILYQA